MQNTLFNYEKWANDAFLNVAKKALTVIENSPNIAVNIYITFYTNHKNTIVSKDVLASYPKQITIVLENDFHDLKVEQNGFYVNLSFNGVRENIFIPFDALITFYDVENNISLAFKTKEEAKKTKAIKFTPDNSKK